MGGKHQFLWVFSLARTNAMNIAHHVGFEVSYPLQFS